MRNKGIVLQIAEQGRHGYLCFSLAKQLYFVLYFFNKGAARTPYETSEFGCQDWAAVADFLVISDHGIKPVQLFYFIK